MYHWVTASLFAMMSVWTAIGNSLAALLSELSCVLKKKKKKNLVHEHLAGHNLVSLSLVTRLLYTDDLVIEFQTILQNLEDVHKSGGCTGILSTTQPLFAMLAVSFSFLFLVPW